MAKQKHNVNEAPDIDQEYQDILAYGWLSYPDREGFIDRFHAHIHTQFEAETESIFSNKEDFKDRLFEVLMIRFDLLRPYKTGLKEIYKNLTKEPPLLLKMRGNMHEIFMDILRRVEFDMGCSVRNRMRLTGLGLIYTESFHVWLDDDSDDSAKTMAHLDKRLNQAHKIANLISL